MSYIRLHRHWSRLKPTHQFIVLNSSANVHHKHVVVIFEIIQIFEISLYSLLFKLYCALLPLSNSYRNKLYEVILNLYRAQMLAQINSNLNDSYSYGFFIVLLIHEFCIYYVRQNTTRLSVRKNIKRNKG